MQSFYNGLSQKSHEQLDATAGGSFMSLTAGKAKILMEKMVENQSWPSSNIQSCDQSEEALEELCALSTKLDVFLNWLNERANYKEDQRAKNAYKQDTSLPINNSVPPRQGWSQ
jgi:hypothetical protein